MMLLAPEWLQKQTIDLKMAGYLREIGEHKGRAEMYGIHVLDAMESLRLVSAEHSAAAACRLERNETSIEQANYQRLVLEIQDSAIKLPLDATTIINIHAELFRDSGRESDGFRSTSVSTAIDLLCRNYVAQEVATESLLLIGAFVLDFLHIQPFETANVRMALLIALWLMIRRGYTMSRFVSMERGLEKQKVEFQAALRQASTEWGEASFNITLWWSCWLEIILRLYREADVRAGVLSGRRGVKTNMVLSLIDSMQGDFSIRQIQQRTPECGIELIRKILKEQKAAGTVKCMGRGPNALWRKKKTRTASVV